MSIEMVWGSRIEITRWPWYHSETPFLNGCQGSLRWWVRLNITGTCGEAINNKWSTEACCLAQVTHASICYQKCSKSTKFIHNFFGVSIHEEHLCSLRSANATKQHHKNHGILKRGMIAAFPNEGVVCFINCCLSKDCNPATSSQRSPTTNHKSLWVLTKLSFSKSLLWTFSLVNGNTPVFFSNTTDDLAKRNVHEAQNSPTSRS